MPPGRLEAATEISDPGTGRRTGFTVPALPESNQLARRLTHSVLRVWARPVDGELTVLLLSELFTNALRHGVNPTSELAATISVDLVETESGLRVEVHDPDQGERVGVAVAHRTLDCESGHGLELVEALSAGWGCDRTKSGKCVYFDVSSLTRSPGGQGVPTVVSRLTSFR